jgi:hypothetical protein
MEGVQLANAIYEARPTIRIVLASGGLGTRLEHVT